MLTGLVTLHKVLGESHRIRIPKLLQREELCVSIIRSVLGLSNATVSQHLLLLREAGTIEARREGKWIHYRLNAHISDPAKRSTINTLLNAVKNDEQIQSDRDSALNMNQVRTRHIQKTTP